jgi:hypothetical protein
LQFVLQFYKNKNRKHSFSNACGCFEMVEATGYDLCSYMAQNTLIYSIVKILVLLKSLKNDKRCLHFVLHSAGLPALA